ncbi:MAG: alpha/beta hydrolase [Lachnoclostridium sp.]|nr:alpha/beta hydrolase [Lachnoclostridium sp.]
MMKINPELLFADQVHDPRDVLSDSGAFEFPCGDGALWGQIMCPDGSFGEGRPCVIFLHGFPGGNRNDDIAHALCRIGCVVLVIHHRGAWGSPGKYLVSNCIEDIKILAEHVRSEAFANQYHVDPESVYLFGHSMGGNNSINAGKEMPWLRGVMLLAPYDSTCYIRKGEPERLRDLMKNGAKFLNCDGANSLYDDIAAHVDEWNFVNAAEALRNQNVLILSGTYDEIAPEADMVVPLWKKLNFFETGAIHRQFSYPAGHALVGCRVMILKDIVKFLEDTL